jgi:hypothetical protein
VLPHDCRGGAFDELVERHDWQPWPGSDRVYPIQPISEHLRARFCRFPALTTPSPLSRVDSGAIRNLELVRHDRSLEVGSRGFAERIRPGHGAIRTPENGDDLRRTRPKLSTFATSGNPPRLRVPHAPLCPRDHSRPSARSRLRTSQGAVFGRFLRRSPPRPVMFTPGGTELWPTLRSVEDHMSTVC